MNQEYIEIAPELRSGQYGPARQRHWCCRRCRAGDSF